MKRAAPWCVLALLPGCTVGPRYHPPDVSIPDSYRNNFPGQTAGASLGDEKWWEVFRDPELQKLIRDALQRNYDVQIAASRILQAQAQVGIARANRFPSLSAGPEVVAERLPIFAFSAFSLLASFSWDIDFWGKYRSATEAARASLLAAQWNRREVVATMVESVATAYFQLRELDLELEISRRTLASRQESLRLNRILLSGGANTLLDVRQAEQLVETAAETIPDLERQSRQQEDQIGMLIGGNPQDIPRGLPLTGQPVPPSVPAGIPSRLLDRRPDIRQAEQQLVAANAEIGVARAQFFPSLPLTGSAGVESTHLSNLLTSPAWTVAAPVNQTIFNAGGLRSNLRLTEAQRQQAVLTYRQTIQRAFQQVSDALIAYRKYREFREHQEALTAAAEDADRLSNMRYRAGSTSYLEVLTSETNLFAAELNLARARLGERLSLVQLYIALGGGWEE